MKRTIPIIAIAILSGCAGSPASIGMKSQEALKDESAVALCNAYAFGGSENARGELERRNALPADEWDLAENKKIKVGMSELSLICSWGKPRTINETVTKYGKEKQYVYREYQGAKGQYVYVRNGQVTGWQQ
jgi:hypothetical protein